MSKEIPGFEKEKMYMSDDESATLTDKDSSGYWLNASGYASSVQTADAYLVSRWY